MNTQPTTQSLAESLKPPVKVMRFVVGAMAGGAAAMLVTVVVSCEANAAILPAAGPMGWISAGVAILAMLASRVVPAVIARQQCARLAAGQFELPAGSPAGPLAALGDAGKLAAIYQTQLIIGCAMLEGAAFFCGVSILIFDGGVIATGVTVSLIVALLWRFPSPSGVARWIEWRLREIELEKTLTERNPLVKR